MRKLKELKKYYDYFVKNKLLTVSLTFLYFMILVIVYNFFCYTIGLDTQINISNIKKIAVVEMISYFIYTYFGNIVTLFFMEDKKNYKEIALMSIPVSLLVYLFKDNTLLGNIFLFSYYFIYRYLKKPKTKTIFTTLGYLVAIFAFQTIFYLFKYQILHLQYNNIDNSLIRLILGMDYYVFIGTLILIKNKLIRK